jgi:hypothetical protein
MRSSFGCAFEAIARMVLKLPAARVARLRLRCEVHPARSRAICFAFNPETRCSGFEAMLSYAKDLLFGGVANMLRFLAIASFRHRADREADPSISLAI